MKRLAPTLLAPLSLAMTACAAQPPPEVAPAPTPPPDAPACREVSSSLHGLRACMPGEPEEVATADDERWMHGLQSTTGDGVFLVARLRSKDPKAKAQALLDSITDDWTRIDERKPFELGGFEGFDASGQLLSARRVRVQAIQVGREVYLSRVERPAGAAGEPQRREEALLRSFGIDVPWRIHASTEGRYTVAVPAPAAWLVDERTVDDVTIKFDLFLIGGEDERVYGIGYWTVPPTDLRSTQEILEAGATGIAAKEGTTILKMRPVILDEAEGRDIVTRRENGVFLRIRIVGARGRIQMAMVTSKREVGLGDADAMRFYDSFQMTTP